MSAHSLPSHVLSIFSDTHIPPCQNNILSSMIFLSLPLLLFPSNFSVASTYSRFPFSKDFPSPVLMRQASAIQSAVWFHLSVSSAFSFTWLCHWSCAQASFCHHLLRHAQRGTCVTLSPLPWPPHKCWWTSFMKLISLIILWNSCAYKITATFAFASIHNTASELSLICSHSKIDY